MSSISQSKYQNRGPLIAVIKIELDSSNIDRIFLHLQDDDQLLAQQFVQKHHLNPMLKKHIHQKILFSRQSVDPKTINYQNQYKNQSNNQQNYQYNQKVNQQDQKNNKYDKYDNCQNDQFTTPVQKRTIIQKQKQQSSIKKVLKQTQKQTQKQRQKYKQMKQPYIAYSDSQQIKIIQQIPRSQQYINRIKQPYTKHSRQNINQQKDVYKIKQKQTFQYKDESLSSSYNNKYKNLYDVSGLKLKNSYPNINQNISNHNHNNHNKDITNKHNNNHNKNTKNNQKYQLDQYTSSQSSQGLFQKQLSNHKQSQYKNIPIYTPQLQISNYQDKINKNINNYPQNINNNNNNNKEFQKQKIPQFHQVNQLQPSSFKLFNKSFSKSNINNNTPLYWPQNQLNPQSFKSSQNITNKPFTSFHKQDPTKFSSIQKSQESDFTDINYISFNKPYNQLPSAILHKNSTNYHAQSSQSYDKNTFSNNIENSLKRIGSIRSNTKNQSSQIGYNNKSQYNKGQYSNDQYNKSQYNKGQYNNKSEYNNNGEYNKIGYSLQLVDGLNEQLQSTRKFSQQKFFTNIKQINSNNRDKRNDQQNRPLNTAQQRSGCINYIQTSRPIVKYYNKEQLKSLKQSGMSNNSRRSLSKSQISKITKQVTNRLYNESEIKKKYIDTLKARAKNLKQQQIQQLQQLRSKPQINMLSKILAQNRIQSSNNNISNNNENNRKRLQDHLIQQGRILQMKRQQLMNKEQRRKLRQCSFKPDINKQSSRLYQLQKSKSKSILNNNNNNVNNLNDSQSIRNSNRQIKNNRSIAHSHSKSIIKKTFVNNQQTFHPQINKLSNQIAKNKGSFQQRQCAFLQQKNTKLFKQFQQQRIKQKTDQISGRQLYQPLLTSNTLKIAKHVNYNCRQKNNKSIHNYLYELSKVSHSQQIPSHRPIINAQSMRIIQQLHDKRLNWLFVQLDSDEDGLISNKRICIDNIGVDILQLIAPVLYQMQQLDTQLNIDDFKQAIKNLNKSLNPYQKSILYTYNTYNHSITN